ncbi:MAG TPA: tetratricopeptide repeat protein [Candidatus Acidoferrales bacterium]|nr:tetratricopeptide repeat protein [Candidatus Acidoferrales bacterium]
MLVNSLESTEREQFIISPARFQLEPPGESPFEAMPATSVTNMEGSFDLEWVEQRSELGISKVEGILKEILKRSSQDVQRFPNDVQVHANYALALMNCGQIEDAIDEFSIALKLSPRHFMSLANMARIRSLQGHFDEAEAIYEQLSSDYPKELSPLVNLSYIFLRTGRLERATLTLKRAIEIDSEAIFPRYLMAVSMLMLRKPHEAISHLRFAARSEVRSPAIYQALGVAYVMAGDPKGAVRSFKTALTLAPDMKDAVHALANVLFQSGHIDGVIELLTVYAEKRPNDIRARESLSEAYFQQKRFPAARLQLTTALGQVNGDGDSDKRQRAKLLNNIGVCFDRQGDSENAMQRFERSIAVHPAFDPLPYHNLARFYLHHHRFTQAMRVLDSCKEIFPDDHERLPLQSIVLAEQNRNDEAIDLLQKEIATGHASPSSYAVLGWQLTDLRTDLGGAENVLREGLKRYPQNALLINNLAYGLLTFGHAVEARKVLTSLPFVERNLKLDEIVSLTATWGLLYLWEGDLARGKEQYERAEQLSRESGQTFLTASVQEKMHLELARALLRRNEIEAARAEIARGLSIKGGRAVYERELFALSERVG